MSLAPSGSVLQIVRGRLGGLRRSPARPLDSHPREAERCCSCLNRHTQLVSSDPFARDKSGKKGTEKSRNRPSSFVPNQINLV
jgi:hypothetical protein